METEGSSSEDNSCANESSGRNSVTGGLHGFPNTSKTGRKGDPRMHRAVGARLANPKISLFGALQIGGFEYENDDDANAVDSEQITLAQRKNQLSRRIRLAQKLQVTTPCTNHGAKSAFENKLTKWPHNLSGKKRQSYLPTSDLLSGDTERSVKSSTTNWSMKVKNKIDCNPSSYHIRARQHPDYHPLMIGISANAFDSSKKSGDNNSMKEQKSQQEDQKIIDGLNTIQEIITAPLHQQNGTVTHTPSAVAITSLSQTAASLGLTLEQLALTLRSSNNLSMLIGAGPTVTQHQKQLALSLYQSEIRSIYQRAMLLAGYKPDIAHDEHSPEHAEFVIDAWQMEGERLSAFMAENLPRDKDAANSQEPIEEVFQSTSKHGDTCQRHNEHVHAPLRDNNVTCGESGPGHNGHAHPNNHKNGLTKNGTIESKGTKNGRHIHRLEGKCGHQPILHQPTGGKPHIDFLIGDRVECYHNVQPSQDLMWPSNYNCEDLSCNDTCCHVNATEATSSLLLQNGTSQDLNASTSLGGSDPKIYNRSEINFESDEWNFDFSAGDSLLGLFKLGDVQQQQHDHEMNKLTPKE